MTYVKRYHVEAVASYATLCDECAKIQKIAKSGSIGDKGHDSKERVIHLIKRFQGLTTQGSFPSYSLVKQRQHARDT